MCGTAFWIHIQFKVTNTISHGKGAAEMWESYCLRPSIKLSLVMRHRCRHPVIVSALVPQLPTLPAAEGTSTYTRGSYHQYLCAIKQQKVYKVHVKSLRTEMA